MRVTLATVGSRGDVQPMIALARALVERGHEPIVAAPPNFGAWVGTFGLAFRPLGVDMQAWLSDNSRYLSGSPVAMFRGMTKYFNDHLPEQFTELAEAARGSAAIVSAGLAFSAASVAKHLAVPNLAVAYSTSIFPARNHPPPTVPWHGLPAWMNDLLWRATNLMTDAIAGDALDAGRAALGLAPVPDLARHLYEEPSFIIAMDEILFPPDPSWRGRYRYANFLFHDDPAELDPALDAWLRAGEAPIFVGFGSMSGGGIDRVGAVLEEAIVATGRRCLVGAGWGGLGKGALPAGWRIVREAPHARLFPRVAAVVHHGGAGTTANALRAGVPQVLVPLILDQFHHAHRLHTAGLAPAPTPMEEVTAPLLSAAITAALALPEAPRKTVADRLRASDGAGQIIHRLEELVRAT